MKSRKLIISIVLTGLILFFIFYFIDFDTFVASLKKVRISYLFLVFIVQLLVYLARAARFEMILQRKGLLIYFSISSVHFFLNKVLPARTGELSMPILFNRFLNISYKKGIGALFLFRFLDLISAVFLLAISLFFVRIEELNHYLLIVFAAIIIILQILFWIKLKLFINLLERILKRIKIKKIEKHKEKLFEYFQQIITYKELRTSGFLVKLILISLFTWLLTYLGFFLIISSFDLDYSIMQVIFATSLA
ncbi:MAG: flippase-like domain-containing protein, partial [Candidatus Cloacimonetes bacterium]|nr:flippase-like domain-containing protein [Candidatus Cloacimonadota bacterium]